ncbi:MAG: hypothetical protein J5449_09985 [Oscillospiraceae bacterium]|nr:hypothetical protein [Oscillospiraceae bacterium]
MKLELAGSYPRVHIGDGTPSFGGSQNWFPGASFRACGCGVIACADTLLFLTGRRELTREEYLNYVNSIRRYFPLIPYRGIDGLRLAIGMNLCLLREGLPYTSRWSAASSLFWDRLAGQLERNIPAIVAIGPNFPIVWGKETLPLYRRTENSCFEATRTRGHFLTVTGLDDEWMRVSSWGQELYISRGDYERYRRENGTLLTSLLYITRNK